MKFFDTVGMEARQLHQASLREDGDHGVRAGDGGEGPLLLGEEEFPEDRALLEDVHDRLRPFVGEGENSHLSVLDDVESVGRVALGEDRGALPDTSARCTGVRPSAPRLRKFPGTARRPC